MMGTTVMMQETGKIGSKTDLQPRRSSLKSSFPSLTPPNFDLKLSSELSSAEVKQPATPRQERESNHPRQGGSRGTEGAANQPEKGGSRASPIQGTPKPSPKQRRETEDPQHHHRQEKEESIAYLYNLHHSECLLSTMC
ncbi:hypothetical protein E2C01_089567 [Portunus trituberculatus]|uniref:Uncharacterized protein n=1 Tax=Portunus trituberculatus TaxID=210409 RepID=A0A5B7JHL0_PORTR|nr:hypothetical protein [Portunus trituberculatus]